MNTPRILQVGEELPPMLAPGERARPGKASKAKGHRETAGRFKVINAFADFALADLDRAEIACWLLLWRDSRDGIAQTSQADLARRAGVTDRTVRRALDRLRHNGLLTVVHRGSLRRGPSSYRVRPLPRDG